MNANSDIDRFLPLTAVAFEILLAVAGEERYGYEIMLAIEKRSAGRISPNPGTLYRALDRLARQGLLKVRVAVPGAGSPGERSKYFRLSELGACVAAAEAERLAGQVVAARNRQLLGESSTGG